MFSESRLLRLASSFRWYLNRAIFPNRIIRATAHSGMGFYGQVREAHLRYIAKYGAFERQVSDWIERYLNSRSERGIFVDIGANIGWYTVHAARSKHVDKVIACEPDLFNARLLQRNVVANQLENVRIAPWAIGGSSGFSTFYLYKASQRGRHSLVYDQGYGVSCVPVRSLDETMAMSHDMSSPIHLIKIDVQGAELQVIDGGRETLSRTPAIVTDLNVHLMKAGRYTGGDLFDRFAELGFSPFLLDESGLHPVSRERLNRNDRRIHAVWMRQ